MSRKPAPPKPEELIAKLYEKFEAFKEEIVKSLEDKGNEIEQVNIKNSEISDKLEQKGKEDKEELKATINNLEKISDEKLNELKL